MASQESLPPFITAGKVYNIKFGKSLIDKPRRKHDHSYQSVSFDFKPISLNATKAAKLSVNHEDHSMTISVPRESAGGKQEAGAEAAESTLFKGPKQTYDKDFVLIWNHASGEITLERVGCTSALKQKRIGNWPPPASTFAMSADTISAPTKSKTKAKVRKSPRLDSESHTSTATNSNKPTLSGFVAGPNLESVRNSSAELSGFPTAAQTADSDSDSDSSSSSNSSSSTSDSSDSTDDSTKHKHQPEMPPLPETHPSFQDMPQYNSVYLSASGSDSN
ncbi:ELL-associated factor 2-like [Oopsacas minuta]|uniref:ELL-associated factor 2-like n=1 Tax=Oopsacas minuta TaxID=111878 RepID=A0AAV7JB38_9METZ|nr:ELL-associated factor 2-like [Oopsacas minuta]